jgi:hypothetical protein
MIKKYTQFIKEANDSYGIVPINSSTYDEISNEVKKMIENTIEKSGGEYKSFLNSFIKNSEDVKVEGFINDSDVYEFYLKFRNDIDEILNDIKFYDESPTEVNTFGLYEYVIKGTEKAFMEIVKILK